MDRQDAARGCNLLGDEWIVNHVGKYVAKRLPFDGRGSGVTGVVRPLQPVFGAAKRRDLIDRVDMLCRREVVAVGSIFCRSFSVWKEPFASTRSCSNEQP
jgi:hypothetical protein